MSKRDGMFDRFSDRVMDLDGPAYGDERERSVHMEAGTFGQTIGIYVALFAALVAAVFGYLLLAVVFYLLAAVPACATHWYAWRRGVSLNSLAETGGARSTMVNIVIICGLATLGAAALAYAVFAGSPLITPPTMTVTPGEGFLGRMVQGGVVGAILGGITGVVGAILAYRKANRGR